MQFQSRKKSPSVVSEGVKIYPCKALHGDVGLAKDKESKSRTFCTAVCYDSGMISIGLKGHFKTA